MQSCVNNKTFSKIWADILNIKINNIKVKVADSELDYLNCNLSKNLFDIYLSKQNKTDTEKRIINLLVSYKLSNIFDYITTEYSHAATIYPLDNIDDIVNAFMMLYNNVKQYKKEDDKNFKDFLYLHSAINKYGTLINESQEGKS
jgi:hypothetical protein